jgi:hypothetical protein
MVPLPLHKQKDRGKVIDPALLRKWLWRAGNDRGKFATAIMDVRGTRNTGGLVGFAHNVLYHA